MTPDGAALGVCALCRARAEARAGSAPTGRRRDRRRRARAPGARSASASAPRGPACAATPSARGAERAQPEAAPESDGRPSSRRAAATSRRRRAQPKRPAAPARRARRRPSSPAAPRPERAHAPGGRALQPQRDARMVAGLIRSLGRAAGRRPPTRAARCAGHGRLGALLVPLGGRADGDGEPVREVAKGKSWRSSPRTSGLERGRRRGREAALRSASAAEADPAGGVSRQARRQRRRRRPRQPRPGRDRRRGRRPPTARCSRSAPRRSARRPTTSPSTGRCCWGSSAPASSAPTELELIGDSELVVRQVRGEYRVKDAGLRALHAEVREALEGFERWSIRNVRARRTARPTAS